MRKRMGEVAFLIVVAGVMALSWLAYRHWVPAHRFSFGAGAFAGMPAYLLKYLDTNATFSFSQPGSDPATGWLQLSSNKWELRG